LLTSNSGSYTTDFNWTEINQRHYHYSDIMAINTQPATSSILSDVNLPVADDIKVLRVVLDQRLTFDKHFSAVARCDYHVQAISHTLYLLTIDLAQMLTCSLILARIDYCNTVLPALHPALSTSCSEYRTKLQGLFVKCQDDHTRTRCCKNCSGCQRSRTSPTSWPCWRSRYGKRQHWRTSVGTSWHVVALDCCNHQTFHFSMCPSHGQWSFSCVALTSWNSLPPSVADCDTLCI